MNADLSNQTPTSGHSRVLLRS